MLKVKQQKINTEKLLSEQSSFSTIEAYNSCRTNIKVSLEKEACKRIIVSSPNESEGKSLTCANLGINFAQAGEKVLIIDCNLRTPTQHLYFKLQNDKGIVEGLNERLALSEIITHTDYENLDVITANNTAAKPSDLLGSQRMSDIINESSNIYSYILIDTPPVNLVTDTAILAAQVLNVLLVVRQNLSKQKEIKKAVDDLNFINAKIIGFVMNDMI